MKVAERVVQNIYKLIELFRCLVVTLITHVTRDWFYLISYYLHVCVNGDLLYGLKIMF